MAALIQRYVSSLPPAERDSFKVGYLSSGWELIEADLSNVRAAVVDILLPQVTGVDLIRHFRRRYPGMGFVPITGMATEPMKRNLKEVLTGGERVLDKPLRREEFLDHLVKAFHRNESYTQPTAVSAVLSKEEGQELWTTSNTNSGVIAVESRRKLPRRKAA